MDAHEVKDRTSFETWLSGRSPADVIWINNRAAMRVLPIALAQPIHLSGRYPDLALLRALITSQAASVFDTKLIRQAAALASKFDAGASVGRGAGSSEVLHAFDAGCSTCDLVNRTSVRMQISESIRIAALASDASLASSGSKDGNHHEIWSEAFLDAQFCQSRHVKGRLPLWSEKAPTWLESALATLRLQWDTEHSSAQFWLRWYDAALAGTPLNWDMHRDIALIPNEDWEQGASHIAGLIAIIEERYRLLQQTAQLKAALATPTLIATANVATPKQRSHNNPPDLVDAEIELHKSLAITRAALDEAELELAKPDPDPSILTLIAEKLQVAAIAIAGYCALLGDIALKKAAEQVGTTGAKWVIAYLFVQSGPVQSLAQDLISFARMLIPGG